MDVFRAMSLVIPNVGDYFLHTFAGESLIIVRESAEIVRAHHNVCRHRGSQLTKAESGNVKLFVCPYHQWSYALDGGLKRAPMMPDVECIDYDKLALKSASAEVWAGMIFINLSPKPEQTLVEALGEPPAGLLKLEPENIRKFAAISSSCAATGRRSWKTISNAIIAPALILNSASRSISNRRSTRPPRGVEPVSLAASL